MAPNGILGCVSAADGHPLWSVPFKKIYHSRGTEFGDAAPPRVFGDFVVIPVGGRNSTLVAFDVSTGREVWKAGDEPASYCPVQPVSLDGRACGLAFLQNSLLLVEVATGKVVWTMELSNGYDEHAAIPLIEGSRFMISSPFRSGATAYVWRIENNPAKVFADQKWQVPFFSNDTASSVLWNGLVFGFDLRDPQAKAHRPSRGEYRCLDWKTGKKLWSTDKVGHATTLVADGKLILFNDRGELILADAVADSYRERGRVTVFDDGVCWTAPAISEGRLLLRTQRHAACFDLRNTSDEIASGTTAAPVPMLADPHMRWSWSQLLNGEREHPFMRPDTQELSRWFRWSLACSVLPGCLIGWLATRWSHRSSSKENVSMRNDVRPVLLGLGVTWLGGIIGSPWLNRGHDDFIFTWPAALFALFAATIYLGDRFQSKQLTWKGELAARGVLVCFLAGCLAYYLALRVLSLPHEWVFLMGFIPVMWPLIQLAKAWQRRGFTLMNAALFIATFSLFFWSCGAWQLYQTWQETRVIAP